MGKALQGLMVILVLLGAGLTACNLTAPNCLEMPAPWSAQPEQSYWTSIDGPGTPVTFTWMFSSDCQPDRFRIVMNDIPIIEDYSLVDERITPTSNPPTVIYEDGTTAFAYSWTTTETFVDGIYWWWVIPYSGFYHGERSTANKIKISSSGGCRGNGDMEENLELVYPRNGQTIHSFSTELLWRDRNPQLTRCNETAVDYLILYSQVYDAIRDININDILDAQPDYIWDFDDGYWEFNWRDYFGYESTEWILPPEISAIPIDPHIHTFDSYRRSIEITLTECRRTYWIVYSFWTYSASPGQAGTFMPSEMRSFDIDSALCEADSVPPPPPAPAESATPVALVLKPANCRSGPTTEYPVLDILVEGAQLPIQGRNQAGDSWLVEDANISQTCWVHGSMVEVIGDISLVEIANPDPPPTAVPSPSNTAPFNCAQFNSNTCTVNNHPCKWTASGCVNE